MSNETAKENAISGVCSGVFVTISYADVSGVNCKMAATTAEIYGGVEG